MIPQLARETHDPQPYLDNPDWSMEQKFDGIRLLIEFSGSSSMKAYSRQGNEMTLPSGILPLGPSHRGVTIWDGEVMPDGTFNVFDLPIFNDRALGGLTYVKRRVIMTKVIAALQQPTVSLVESVNNNDAKHTLLDSIRLANLEGVVFKHNSSTYRFNYRSSQWLKYKLYKSCSVIVTELCREGKPEAVTICLADGHEVSGCKIPERYQRELNIAVGDIIEVKYLTVTSDLKITQPTFLRKRTDLTVLDCTKDQFVI